MRVGTGAADVAATGAGPVVVWAGFEVTRVDVGVDEGAAVTVGFDVGLAVAVAVGGGVSAADDGAGVGAGVVGAGVVELGATLVTVGLGVEVRLGVGARLTVAVWVGAVLGVRLGVVGADGVELGVDVTVGVGVGVGVGLAGAGSKRYRLYCFINLITRSAYAGSVAYPPFAISRMNWSGLVVYWKAGAYQLRVLSRRPWSRNESCLVA